MPFDDGYVINANTLFVVQLQMDNYNEKDEIIGKRWVTSSNAMPYEDAERIVNDVNAKGKDVVRTWPEIEPLQPMTCPECGFYKAHKLGCSKYPENIFLTADFPVLVTANVYQHKYSLRVAVPFGAPVYGGRHGYFAQHELTIWRPFATESAALAYFDERVAKTIHRGTTSDGKRQEVKLVPVRQFYESVVAMKEHHRKPKA